MRKALFLLIPVLLSACKVEVNTVEHYNLQQLVTEQVRLLDEKKPKSEREVQLDSENSVYADADWKSDLEDLRKLDLNESRYKTDYKVIEGSEGELKTLIYYLDREKVNGVRKLKVVYRQQPDRPLKLHLEKSSTNLMYNSRIAYDLHFNEENLLKHYRISGDHKLVFRTPSTMR